MGHLLEKEQHLKFSIFLQKNITFPTKLFYQEIIFMDQFEAEMAVC